MEESSEGDSEPEKASESEKGSEPEEEESAKEEFKGRPEEVRKKWIHEAAHVSENVDWKC